MSAPGGPTYREAAKRLRLDEQITVHKAQLVAAWRAQHPAATCDDRTALTLAELHRDFGGRASRTVTP